MLVEFLYIMFIVIIFFPLTGNKCANSCSYCVVLGNVTANYATYTHWTRTLMQRAHCSLLTRLMTSSYSSWTI